MFVSAPVRSWLDDCPAGSVVPFSSVLEFMSCWLSTAAIGALSGSTSSPRTKAISNSIF